ncbi:hypothetical protein Q5P01_008551 [Channa striata]|uniref:RRM domain-containing protein n=1 Tax=Channa striata TaxID=64152 RepID=A0AA88SST3_CHASR|nr:hypothetical protein Q5P01_008551 [Channa striata]
MRCLQTAKNKTGEEEKGARSEEAAPQLALGNALGVSPQLPSIMSNNYPYRRPSDTDLRSEAGPYRSTDRRHASPDHDFYRPPQKSFSSGSLSSSSSRGLTSAQCSQDGALSILSSCGLEPSDLALLAELPEDVLTVESLPHVLAQIKGKRGTIRSFPTNSLSAPSSSSSSSSYHRPHASSSTSDWGYLSSHPVQYSPDQVTHGPLLSDQDCWGNPRTSSSVRAQSTPSSTTRYVVDFKQSPGPPEYGKMVRATGPVSSQELHSFNSTGQKKRTYPAQFSERRSADYGTASTPDEYRPKPRVGHRESQTSSIRSRSREAAAASIPSEKKALDFHGTCPKVFPYSCSLCDITVLSEKVWIKHINGTQHAEGQLTLLQQFPNWDCRLESVSRANNQSENWKGEEKTSRSSQTANQNHKPQPNVKPEKKASEKSKVVCVRFPPQSVDETYLRKLTEPFGKIVKILMFPSLAFVELGSIDQAKDLVKFHINYPPTVNGEKIQFRISNTFNFLQSSQVVSFTPVPKDEDGKSDLISTVKRFGPLLYTLFLPSMAFVEMKNASDAQKLIDYYSCNVLRINNDYIKVAFSGEYKTLMRVPSARKYEEEPVCTKRTRSLSEEKDESKRRRSGNKEQDQGNRKSSREKRSRSRETTSREKRTNTRSKSRDNSRDESNKERNTRSRSRDEISEKSRRGTRSRLQSREKSSRESKTRSRSRSRDKSNSRSSRQNSSSEKKVKEKTPETESRTEPPSSLGEAAEKPQIDEKAGLSAEESDIEGMEVIGEDGENVEEDDVEIEDDTDGEEEEGTEENNSQAERREEDNEKLKYRKKEEKLCEMKREEDSETRGETVEATEHQLEYDKEPDFPIDLENCITLDELEEDQSDGGGDDNKDESRAPSTRVIYFKDLPMSFYTDVEFVKLVKDFGKAVRYLLIRRRQEGFIEMSSPLEAQKAAKELSCNFITFKGSKVNVRISHRYYRLSNGWEVPSNSDNDKSSQSSSSSRRRERRSKSKTSERDEICEKGKESSKDPPEKESGSKTSTEKKPDKESPQKKTEEKDLTNSSKKESNARKTVQKESGSKTSTEKKPDKESPHKETEEKDLTKKESNARKPLEKEPGFKKSASKESLEHETQEKDVRNTVRKELNVTKSPEKEASDKNIPKAKSDRESLNNNPVQEESVTAGEESLEKNPEQMRTEKECDARKSAERQSVTDNIGIQEQAAEDQPFSGTNGKKGPEKEQSPGMSLENKILKTPGKESVHETLKNESDSDESQTEKEHLETGEKDGSAEEKLSEGQGICIKEEPSESAIADPEPVEQQIKQEPDNKQQLQGSEEAEQRPVPARDTANPEKHTEPVGTEFVRPVVGYFCHLCQLIYADEDEAKLQHCSSSMHYKKYQEKTGKNPWSS